jgi:uncharacterized membrane protein YbaN (DUF454 family)
LTRHLVTLLWRALALASLALGLLGIFVPGLPTVPFLLVAAWAGSHGWARLEQWLLNHPRHGADIRRWRERGAVPRRAKWASSIMMALSAAIMLMLAIPLWAKVSAPLLMAAVAVWLWRRPEH